MAGRIIFTISKGLVGVGLPRKSSGNTPDVTVTTPDGRSKIGKVAMAPSCTLPPTSTGFLNASGSTDSSHQKPSRTWYGFCLGPSFATQAAYCLLKKRQ
jgi:hypothetical protein